MESKPAFVWTQGRVELHPIATVDLDLVFVVFPDDTELDDSLRDGSDLEGGLVLGILLEERGVLESGDELWKGKTRSALGFFRPRGGRVCPTDLCTPVRIQVLKGCLSCWMCFCLVLLCCCSVEEGRRTGGNRGWYMFSRSRYRESLLVWEIDG